MRARERAAAYHSSLFGGVRCCTAVNRSAFVSFVLSRLRAPAREVC